MNKETIFIIIIIIFFNFLLLNIFKLQNELSSLENTEVTGLNNFKYDNFKNIHEKCDGLNIENKIGETIKNRLDKIASYVPIDINKINNADANFIPKYKQIETI